MFCSLLMPMVLHADSKESLQVNLKKLDETLLRWEIKMNWEKTGGLGIDWEK